MILGCLVVALIDLIKIPLATGKAGLLLILDPSMNMEVSIFMLFLGYNPVLETITRNSLLQEL